MAKISSRTFQDRVITFGGGLNFKNYKPCRSGFIKVHFDNILQYDDRY